MINNYFQRGIATAMLGIAALLLLGGKSNAQQNSLVFPWQAQGARQSPYIYQSAPSSPNIENSRAFYPSSANADKVLVEVRVPAGAKIFFEGAKTTQTGEVRHFVSPSLAEGYNYTYHVQATWTENGREVNQSRSFNVRRGDFIHMIITRDEVKVRSEN
jgi:uncharacterized protein (TIGR03000 family)